jgi:anti-sigma factor RsiW
MNDENRKNPPATCRDVIALLSDYIEGELSPGDAAALERHMVDCPPCERFLRSLETSVEWTRRLDNAEVPVEVPTEVMDRLRDFLRTRTPESGGSD